MKNVANQKKEFSAGQIWRREDGTEQYCIIQMLYGKDQLTVARSDGRTYTFVADTFKDFIDVNRLACVGRS